MSDYDDKVEMSLAHRISRLAQYWKYEKKEMPTSIKCIHCENNATAVFYCANGSNFAFNKIQPLCEYHQEGDWSSEMYVLEDFRA